MVKAKFDVAKHVLVPKHQKLGEREKKELMAKYSVTLRELPKVLLSDPAIESISLK